MSGFRFIAGALVLSLSTVVCTADAAFSHGNDGMHASAIEHESGSHSHINNTAVDVGIDSPVIVASEEHCAECFESSVALRFVPDTVTVKHVATARILPIQTAISDQESAQGFTAFRSREGPLFEDAILFAQTLVLRT